MHVWLIAAMLMANGTNVLGDWQSPTGSVIRVGQCGTDVCLTVVKLPPNPPSTMDGHNPDVKLRTRPICGLAIGTGFTQTSEGKLEDGHLYDPTNGKTYKGVITAQGETLKLRGYVGISAFGRSETWKRVPRVESCKA